MDSAELSIVDGHAHVPSTKFVPQEFIDGIAWNVAARAAPMGPAVAAESISSILSSQLQDHFADDLVAQLDQAGVARAVLLLPDFTAVLPCSLTIEEMALCHHEIRERHPNRFYVLQGVDPSRGEDGVAFFQKALTEYGFNGLKLYPPCGYFPGDVRLFPYYEICASSGLPVLLHTGPTSPRLSFEYGAPQLVDRAAQLFPKVNFILAHGGVNSVSEAALLCAYRPNVYLDISGFLSALHPRGWKEHLREVFALGINHKVIFGTDWPFGKLGGGYARVLSDLLAPDGPFGATSKADVKNIMGGTMMRLLGDVLK